ARRLFPPRFAPDAWPAAVLAPASGPSGLRLADPHLRPVRPRPRHRGGHRRRPPGVGQGGLEGRSGEVAGHRADARLRRLRLHADMQFLQHRAIVPLSIALGALFGLIALLLIEAMRGLERALRRFERHPYLVAVAGGLALAVFYAAVGDLYAGLGTGVIESAL